MTGKLEALGIFTVLFSFIGYFLYFRSIFRNETKPHPFTWAVFTIIDATVFVAQISNGGGPGAWVIGVAAVLNFFVVILSLNKGEKRITRVDWATFILALAGILLWWITSEALSAVLLAGLSDALAKIPTLRKAYSRPNEESLSIWSLDLIKFSLSIAALSTITMTTAFFQAEALLTNALLVVFILFRRRQLAKGV